MYILYVVYYIMFKIKTNVPLKYIIFIGRYGPCSQIRGLINNLNLIKLSNRKLIEPIILSHYRNDTANDINYIKYSTIFQNNLPVNMTHNGILFKLNNNTINHYVLSRDSNEESLNVYKLGYEYYSKSIKEYYNIEVKNVNFIRDDVTTTIVQKLLNDNSRLIILSDFNCNNNNSFIRGPFYGYLKMNKQIEHFTTQYIHKKFNNEPFLAINIRRLKDNEQRYANWKDFYGFAFKDLYDTLVYICNKSNINKKNIFLSIKQKVLSLYKDDIMFDKINIYDSDTIPNNIQCYIEQNIASKSRILIYTEGSVYSDMICGLSRNNSIKNHTSIVDISILKSINTNRSLCRRTIGIK